MLGGHCRPKRQVDVHRSARGVASIGQQRKGSRKKGWQRTPEQAVGVGVPLCAVVTQGAAGKHCGSQKGARGSTGQRTEDCRQGGAPSGGRAAAACMSPIPCQLAPTWILHFRLLIFFQACCFAQSLAVPAPQQYRQAQAGKRWVGRQAAAQAAAKSAASEGLDKHPEARGT